MSIRIILASLIFFSISTRAIATPKCSDQLNSAIIKRNMGNINDGVPSAALTIDEITSNEEFIRREDIVYSLQDFDRTGKIIVGQKEYAIATGDDSFPILITLGLGPCFSVAGYDKKSKIGFLSHFANFDEFNNAFDSIVNEVKQILKNRKSSFNDADFKVVLSCGYKRLQEFFGKKQGRDFSWIIKKIEQQGMKVIAHDLEVENIKSLALDNRTGAVFNYEAPKTKKNYFKVYQLRSETLESWVLNGDDLPAARYISGKELFNENAE